LIGGVGVVGAWNFRPSHREAVAPLSSLAHCVGYVRVCCFAQAALRALDSPLEGPLLGVVEFFLTRLCIAKKLECALVLLVIQVIQAIP
jgi:hypothetical protein